MESRPLLIKVLEKSFNCNARLVAEYPILTIVICVLFTIISTSIIPFKKIKDDFKIGYTPSDARSLKEMESYSNFSNGDLIALMVYVTAKDGGNMLRIEHLNATVDLIDNIGSNFKIKNSSFYEFCDNFCNANEPVAVFRNGLIIQQNNLLDSGYIDNDRINLSYPFMSFFGRSIDLTMNFHGVELIKNMDNVVDVITNLKSLKLIFLMFRASKPHNWTDDDIAEWDHNVADFCDNMVDSPIVAQLISFPLIQAEIVRTAFTLFPYLSVGFIIMCICALITIYTRSKFIGQWSYVRIFYAVSACVCPLLAAASTLGILFWLGFRFGSVLLSVPFLVLAVGVDDSFIMICAWERLLAKTDQVFANRNFSYLVAELLKEVGPSITITSLTNTIAFGIGALFSPPEVQLFCIANAVAMIFDLLYCITLFAAILLLATKYERSTPTWNKEEILKIEARKQKAVRFLTIYCTLLSKKFTAIAIGIILLAYWSLSIYGILRVKSDIVLKKLLIADSPLNQVYDMRKKYIFPEYSFVTVFVNNVGNLLKTERIERIKSLVNSFEEIPECNGPHFTQIWIREYEQYRKNMDENIDDEKERSNFYSMDDIREFLNWPENRRWGGYMKINNETNSIDNFFFIVIYHGQHLADYNERHRMLHLWRFIADKYQDLSVSVFDDGAQFIDQLEILKPLTVQSSLGTLIAMTMVCYLFMYTIPSVIIASCCTLSIFIGVFGFLTMWNITLDPLSMSTLILTIGLSVEFSAHISYHYFRNAFEINSSCKIQRMVRCFCHIGYPLFQCCISTMLYILCFLFVDSYTSEIFVKAIITVMSLGMIHAFIIMPVVLCASSRYN